MIFQIFPQPLTSHQRSMKFLSNSLPHGNKSHTQKRKKKTSKQITNKNKRISKQMDRYPDCVSNTIIIAHHTTGEKSVCVEWGLEGRNGSLSLSLSLARVFDDLILNGSAIQTLVESWWWMWRWNVTRVSNYIMIHEGFHPEMSDWIKTNTKRRKNRYKDERRKKDDASFFVCLS